MAVQASEPLVDLLQEGMEWVTVAVGQPVEWEMEELLEESLKYTEEATVALITLSEVLVEVEAEVADTSKKSGVLVAERGGGDRGRDGTERAIESLQRLVAASQAFRETISAIDTQITDLELKITRMLWILGGVLFLVFLWHGAAQFLLLRWGWKNLDNKTIRNSILRIRRNC